jgi:glycosyltransferase involved in cell wall biosynthesis
VRLDIVLPAHDEEHRIGPTLDAYCAAVPGDDVRFVVAADACCDGTCDVVGVHAAEDPRVQLREFPKLGKGGVIAAAFAASDADLVAFVDADGATPPRELLRLVAATGGADGAIASRRHPAAVLPARRPLARRVTSAGFAFAVRRLMRMPYADTQCGAKVLRRDVVRAVLPRLEAHDLLFDVDLLAAAREFGFRVVEVPTIWIDREGSRVRPVADTRRMGGSLLRLWARRRVAERSRGRRRPAPDAVRAPVGAREVARAEA